MGRQEKIKAVMAETGVDSEVAEAYLVAEEWLVTEAVYDILAECKSGMI